MGFENFMNFGTGFSGFAGAATSLIGGIGSGIQARKNRKLARELAQKQMDFEREEAEKAFSRNYKMWNEENAYNSPMMQMRRLEQAGLNPNLAYGSLASGAAGSPPQYQPVSYAQPSDAAYQDSFAPISQMGANLSNSALADAQVAQTRSQTRNVELQNYRLALENENLLPAQITDALNSFAYNKDLRDQTLALGALQIKQANKDLAKADKELQVIEKQLQGLDYENRIKAVEASISELTKSKKFESLCAQYDMTIEQGKHYAEMLGYELKTGQYNATIAYSRMLEESSDNDLVLLETSENKLKSKIGKEKLEGRKYTVGDSNTKLGRVAKALQRFSGFFQSVSEGIGQAIGTFVGEVAGPALKAFKGE